MIRLYSPILALPLLIGCGGTNPVQPKDMTAGMAAGEACDPTALSDETMTFVVDWQDGQRAAIESAMRKGVAVVKYSCEGVKVLTSCRVRGDYQYAGTSTRRKVINMKDAVAAQAQFGGRVVGAAFQGEFAQNRSLDMAYLTVGAESTTVAEANTAMLTGRCKGATHFVYEAQVGAFAVSTNSAGSASAFVEVFGQGSGGASTSAGKGSVTRDGDIKACESASKRDVESTDGCSAAVRLSLIPIDKAAAGSAPPAFQKAGVPDLRTCPANFEMVDDACVSKAAVAAAPAMQAKALCAKNDYMQCFDRCVGGEAGSCGRLGLIFLQSDALKRSDSSFDAAHFKANAAKIKAPLAGACTDGEPNACVAAGRAAAHVGYVGQDAEESFKTPGAAAFHREILALDVEGCVGGEGVACEQMVASINLPGELQSMTIAQMLPILKAGCAKSAYACLTLGGLYSHNDGTKFWSEAMDAVQKDAAVARKAFSRACDGGLADGCWALGLMHMPESDATDIGMKLDVDRGTLSSMGAFATLGEGQHDAAKGKALLKRACDLGEDAFIRAPREVACAIK